ncbi:tol-pal system YbgF family protein [Leptolyngbyaceae cyanobacterium UHCC 1019]
MLDQVAAAFERQDYQTAAQLLKELLKRSPQDPWVQLYVARLQEVSGKTKAAEGIYRQLLKSQTNSKLIAQARQGLQRLGGVNKEPPKPQAIAVTRQPSSANPGFMILSAVPNEARSHLGQCFASVMNLDVYTARALLPSRGWKLYRAGAFADLQEVGQALKAAEIPVFWSAVSELEAIQVFHVSHFTTLEPNPIVVCKNESGQLGSLSFAWSEVAQRVEGILPLFSQVVELGYRDRPEWKDKIEDYAHFCDLHIPSRRCILRIHDSRYNFKQGALASFAADTIRQRWNHLLTCLNHQLPQAPIWSDFTPFSETVDDFIVPLSRLKPQLFLSRAEDCYLDSAFHLYSTLAFLKSSIQ